MAFKKFESERNETWKPEKGDILEGVFVQRRMVNTTNGLSSINTIEVAGGEKKDVWGNAMLDSFFTNIPVGCMVRMTYQGKLKSAKGGREYHGYVLEHDDETVDPMSKAQLAFDVEKAAEEAIR